MKLIWKLFISYLVVVLIGALVLAETTSYTAPLTFQRHIESMRHMMDGPTHQSSAALEAELNQSFRDALNSSLLIAFVAATLTAGSVSFYVSRRILRPVRQLVAASQRIADGHYDEQLTATTHDELGDLTRSFNQMAQKLAETETMRQHLIADVSHELKTPLASIKAYMEGLQDGVIPTIPETFRQIQQEASRLERLVHDLQELSRAEAGQLQLQATPLDLKGLVQTTVDWMQPQFISKTVHLACWLPPSSVIVTGDHDRLRQALLNILGNALQYTPTGGQVSVQLQTKGHRAHLRVKDSGVGLADTDLSRIFQRFYRVDQSRARASGGSGIGLTIARHIVWAHQGDLWAESAGLGYGSTFHFDLPLST